MKRNSTQLELITPGAVTWLPWISDLGSNRVDGYPSFDSFAGQSRSIRESAWQTFLDSGNELEVIPDPLPPPPEPDWDGFLTPFYTPAFGGTTPFHIVETAAQNATINAETVEQKHASMSLTRHWSNCIAGLLTPSVRSVAWLASSWKTLLELLTQNGVALTEEQRQGIEALFKQYYLM